MGRPVDLNILRAALERPAAPSSDYDLNPDIAWPEGRKLRPAAVLIAIADSPGGAEVILTKRASHLKHHPGQIAFPGGKLDDGDADLVSAALREAEEEIGLPRDLVSVLELMPIHETVTSYEVTPVVAALNGDFDPIPEPGEVAEIFRVPLAFLMDPSAYRVERRRWRGVWRQFYVVPYGPYYIWGATARMLKSLADRVEA
ncbi:CoA pyrophosphatase [Roseobacter sp. HKCCD9010]|uniref:CoA pyrophosphatase n=1 Tax=unclassified Roseobacter TaxID=196798 RepID=UPI0014931B4C|nr:MULTISPECIES: CoA pyrophosphatase [unclassified Roseobacter]MBF9048498.1 CoA pyrophosphatase [Rhodobacterales bacterium HKCCD4356]NNV10497.1 CoA pyrophosphatase [Roseobacter sp. HKCCD7357]NNV14682.1 CoA pyrophosphatase [Roseobacter sp. HKCCD8768]NNV24141.1 CoA pyrophosphatase [Roseobacter sp. HKCCD8192]NNV28398.1 CoA pyrophosphatase [Roseobacter sp. HKCCD9061]